MSIGPNTSRRSRGSSWIHDSIDVADFDGCGLGAFALSDIKKDTLLIMYGGAVITKEDFDALPEHMQHFPFQVADELFLGPIDENDIGIGERINHSCSPNAGFSSTISLVAIRDIEKGEAITIDYATCVASNDDAFQLQCGCQSDNCRRVITGNDWRLKDVQDRLLPFFQPFLQDKVRNLRPNGHVKMLTAGRVAENDDKPQPLQIANRAIRKLSSSISKFLTDSLKQEWMAIPVCLIAGIPSTLLTIAIMDLIGSLIKRFNLESGDLAYIASFSAISSIVGYGTYLVFYYTGMLWKERAMFWKNGHLSRSGLGRIVKVIRYDFIAHLPYDYWIMPLMGAATAGCFAVGASQSLSIFLVHSVADVAYAIKEPFFWHGAKKLVAWRESKSSD
jgi:hypothetical protein